MRSNDSQGASQLVELVLSHAAQLQLTSEQISHLNAAYWAKQGETSLEAALELLTPEQTRKAMILFARSHGPDITKAQIDAAVSSAMAEKFKDSSAVEIEIAASVANRLVDWSKIFAFCVAIPLAVLFLIFGLFGYSRFEDVRTAADRVDSTIDTARQQIEQRIAKADGLLSTLKRKMAEIDQANQRTDAQIAQLQHSVTEIRGKLGDMSAEVETGNAPPGSVYRDPAGFWAYGPWALTAQNAGRLVKSPSFPFQQAFKDLVPGTASFNQAWSRLGMSHADQFREAQRVFFGNTVMVRAADDIKQITGTDIRDRSSALQDIILTVYNIGPRLVRSTVSDMKARGAWTPSAADFDRSLVNALFDRLKASDLAQKMPALRRNYEKQRQNALARLRTGK